MLHAGKVLSKIDIIDHIYTQDYDRDSNVIAVFIRRLRSKLHPDKKLSTIETLCGSWLSFNIVSRLLKIFT